MKRFIVLILLIVFLVVSIYGLVNFLGKDIENKTIPLIKNVYQSYNDGDYVTFNNMRWYVLYDSDENTDYVTLISADVISLEDEGIGEVVNGIYESSDLNKYLKNNYANMLGKDKLVELNGYKVRLFDKSDLDNILNVEYDLDNDEYNIINCPEYICLTNNYYATMVETNKDVEFEDVYLNIDDIEDSVYGEYELHLNYYNISSTYEKHYMNSIVDTTSLLVRPIINVYKEYIE